MERLVGKSLFGFFVKKRVSQGRFFLQQILVEFPQTRFTKKTVWNRPESERYYNFTELACQLNEEEEGVAPSDSRKRPDQRLMENGLWDEANDEKLRLEEKQRTARKQRETEAELAVQEGIILHTFIFLT